jgi:hypothetical protein
MEYLKIKLKYLGSILEATGAATVEIEERISEGRRMISMSCRAKLSFTKPKKTYVPGFSAKYFTIWSRNMDTKHTTGKQITGN